MVDETVTEPRFERFEAHYPSGTVLSCHYPGGCTIQEAKVLHLYAVVKPVKESQVGTPGED